MRVPRKFKDKVFFMSKKYDYPSTTEFLEKDGTKVFDNADYINDLIRGFSKVFKRSKKKQ